MAKAKKAKTKHVELGESSVSTASPVLTEEKLQGSPCLKHGAVNHYVKNNTWGCTHCDRERDDAEVERIVLKIKTEREAEAAKRPPFHFVSAAHLFSSMGPFAGGVAGFRISSPLANASEILEQVIRHWEENRVSYYAKHTKSPCTTPMRWKLPDIRMSVTHHFEIGDETKDGVSAYITAGMYEDYRLGEVFIRAAKQGTYVSGFTDAFATATSIMLQHGVPLEMLSEKFQHQAFEPAGFVRGGGEIKMCKSVIDYIMRWLLLHFPKGYMDQKYRGQSVYSKEG